jgi:CubicO group peptidase (beta-lactamase class C family)
MRSILLGLFAGAAVLSTCACERRETVDSGQSAIGLEDEVIRELSQLAAGGRDPSRALAGLAVAVLRGGEPRFEATFGRAFIDPAGDNDRELTADNLIRVASISKTLSAVVVLQLVEEGVLDLDRDVSEYLGWELRNPNFPDRAITLRHLLAHVSSIRDAGESYIIRYPRALKEAFDPASADFEGRFQIAEEGRDRGPGAFYEYCNLNFGVVGTVLERVTGARFDRLMHERFFAPLGLAGGFNVAEFPDHDQMGLATLYRKRDRDDVWHPEGDWVVQADDPTAGIAAALPENADYVPGVNGAQFSPQGGARLSLRGMETLAKLLLGDGSVGDVRVLSPASMAELRRPVWRYDPEKENLDSYKGRPNARAVALRIITSETPADRLFVGDDRRWFGHFGEAYGLMAGVWVHPESGDGVIYAVTGTAFDPSADDDGTSSLSPIEARIVAQLGRLL